MRIGVVAPGCRLDPALAARTTALAAEIYGARVEVVFHPQCFLLAGHFAGEDAQRAAAFLDVANDPSFDALWFARGGYGACRIGEAVLAGLKPSAREKLYLGYSDAGSLLAALYKCGARVAHGPMPSDMARASGEAAVRRALAYLIDADRTALEPHLASGVKYAAFNITILSQLLGTPLEPDLSSHVLLLEEVSEHMYRIDRYLFHITSQPSIRRAAGLRLGRCSLIPPNDPDFLQTEEDVAKHWCAVSGLNWLGRADIGHDTENKVVPFGAA